MDEPITLVQMFQAEKPVNRQLYENNARAQDLVEDLLKSEDRLVNTKTPNLVIEHEKPEHRLVLLYKMKGLSNREIAAELGYTEPWVSQITRQPWFQERLIAALSEAEGEVLDKIIKIEARNSFFTVVELRDNAKNEAVRERCANSILDRYLGKAVQRTETQSNVFHVTAKLEDLDKQLQEVEAAEQALLSRGTTEMRHVTAEIPDMNQGGAGEPFPG